MASYFCSIAVLGQPVMCDTIQAGSTDEAKRTWEAKFWADPDLFRAELPRMDAVNRECGERLLLLMEATREEARRWGITVTARLSRAKAA